MGIRFFCPSGHRLHVKSFLAGKRGVCPDCGTSVEIPMQSDARAVSSKKRGQLGGAPDSEQHKSATAVLERPETDEPIADHEEPSAHDDFALPPSLGLPPAALPVNQPPEPVVAKPNFEIESARPTPVTPAPAVAAVKIGTPSPGPNGVPLPPATVPTGAAVAVPVVPAPAGAAASVLPPAGDPISEAPMAIWYVRPTAGGQYGPARGDVMRKWLTEGRVTTDSLVWREGWPDWRPAAKVFPDLNSKATTTGAVVGPVIPDAPRRVIRPPRKASTAQGVGIVITLAVVCIGLFAALLYVLMNSGSPPPTP
jgi:hypothetical protein